MSEALPDSRPVLRADCIGGPRPCPWINCRWHLCWERRDIHRLILGEADPCQVAAVILNMGDTCVLDVAASPRSDREVGAILGVSHQAVAQACKRALVKLRAKHLLKRGYDEICGHAAQPAWRWGNSGMRGINAGR